MENTANSEVRKFAKENKVSFWEIADKLNCHENTVQRKLRHELSPEEKQIFMNTIRNISEERK